MQKMLCPYCDHEIKGKGKCDFCGSRVKKPVIAEVSEEFDIQASANLNEGSTAETLAASDSRLEEGAEAAGEAKTPQGAPGRAVLAQEAVNQGQPSAPGGPPRRAVLASEAVERGQTTVKGGNSTVVKVIVAVVIINIIVQILMTVLKL